MGEDIYFFRRQKYIFVFQVLTLYVSQSYFP